MVKHENLFAGIYEGKKVIVTGHTGFKGSWLSLWLHSLGAKVYGYSLTPPTEPNHHQLLKLGITNVEGDIRDHKKLEQFVSDIKPDIVFHLAAQALVRESYLDPRETYTTNVIGMLNIFEACRKTESVKAIVNVTSDKCYENKEWIWGYRENDPMGGYDPYSSSKGCAELLAFSYRNSFFSPAEYKKTHHILMASGRAGNVIGGGDWAKDRLIPDIVKAASENKSVSIRNPKATRPWQHVLEPLSGYLTLGWHLLEGKKEFAEGWNFGPGLDCNISVDEILTKSKAHWNSINAVYEPDQSKYHEANLLMLDCSKAQKLMKWKPVWGLDDTIGKTIDWYKAFYTNDHLNSEKNLEEYIAKATSMHLTWAQ